MTPELIVPVGLIGLCVGSFVTTAALRASRGESFILGRSRCDGCGASLSFLVTVPVAAYIARGGVARCCAGPIDPAHLVGELAGLGIALIALVAPDPLSAGLLAAMGFVLLSLSVIDIKIERLPDGLVLATGLIAIAMNYSAGGLALGSGLVAGLLAFAILAALRQAFSSWRGTPGLGGGDVKLLAALAIWLGGLTPILVVAASVIGLLQLAILKPVNRRISFGPAIAGAGFAIGSAQILMGGIA